MSGSKACSIRGCVWPAVARGLCAHHWRMARDPELYHYTPFGQELPAAATTWGGLRSEKFGNLIPLAFRKARRAGFRLTRREIWLSLKGSARSSLASLAILDALDEAEMPESVRERLREELSEEVAT